MMRYNQRSGYTLVEVSITLVIIGIVIGGVLIGQQIIQNARITNALNAIQAYQAQFQTYAQNYGALPGDDTGAPARFGAAVPEGKRNGNGVLDGSFDAACDSNFGIESCLVWADLRAAQLIKNQSTSNAGTAIQPPNPFNGIYGFQNGAFAGSANAFTTVVLCLNNVPGAAAQTIDTRLDDGIGDTGSVQSMVSTGTPGEAINGTPVTTYLSSQTYTMCIHM